MASQGRHCTPLKPPCAGVDVYGVATNPLPSPSTHPRQAILCYRCGRYATPFRLAGLPAPRPAIEKGNTTNPQTDTQTDGQTDGQPRKPAHIGVPGERSDGQRDRGRELEAIGHLETVLSQATECCIVMTTAWFMSTGTCVAMIKSSSTLVL
mmetsp:Transcript_22310/g.63683  ORF Transcript_22310/g.63683 Transcript_22310/m.63683 type:complete len:152 (+) Transcript_22310:74-529(+)